MNVPANRVPASEDFTGPGDRVAAFIDAANFQQACRSLGLRVDYRRLWRFLESHGDLVWAGYHTGDPGSRGTAFLEILHDAGYVVQIRSGKMVPDSQGGKRVKGNVDGDLIVDFMATQPSWDVAWIASGDSDYEAAVKHAQSLGKRVLVLSGRRALSRELAQACDGAFLIEDTVPRLRRVE